MWTSIFFALIRFGTADIVRMNNETDGCYKYGASFSERLVNKKMKNNVEALNVIQGIQNENMCFVKCIREPKCEAIEYNKNMQQCSLFELNYIEYEEAQGYDIVKTKQNEKYAHMCSTEERCLHGGVCEDTCIYPFYKCNCLAGTSGEQCENRRTEYTDLPIGPNLYIIQYHPFTCLGHTALTGFVFEQDHTEGKGRFNYTCKILPKDIRCKLKRKVTQLSYPDNLINMVAEIDRFTADCENHVMQNYWLSETQADINMNRYGRLRYDCCTTEEAMTCNTITINTLETGIENEDVRVFDKTQVFCPDGAYLSYIYFTSYNLAQAYFNIKCCTFS